MPPQIVGIHFYVNLLTPTMVYLSKASSAAGGGDRSPFRQTMNGQWRIFILHQSGQEMEALTGRVLEFAS